MQTHRRAPPVIVVLAACNLRFHRACRQPINHAYAVFVSATVGTSQVQAALVTRAG